MTISLDRSPALPILCGGERNRCCPLVALLLSDRHVPHPYASDNTTVMTPPQEMHGVKLIPPTTEDFFAYLGTYKRVS